MLNVEYVVMGEVLQDMGNLVTVSHNRSSAYQGRDRYHHDKNLRNWSRGEKKYETRATTTTKQHVETQVSISVYNGSGERVYTKSRQSILTENDAYKNALHYLLKRTPIYKR
jgi:hypothetical protein